VSERVVLIDYGSGNLRSAAKALERAASETGRAVEVLVTASPRAVAIADRLVLPGVGAFGQCASALRACDGLEEALNRRVLEEGRPFLGICVGMQLLARRGLEHGLHMGLGWIEGEVVRLDPSDPRLKVPHMGWNSVGLVGQGPDHPVLKALPAPAYAYFVHSFHLRPADPGAVLATTDYGGTVNAIVGRDNILGTQFHPEKSQEFGLALLRRFLNWTP